MKNCIDCIRRSLQRNENRAAQASNEGTSLKASELGDGRQNHYRFGQHDEQGFRGDRSQMAFALRTEQIEVVVHPQSIVHSLVQFQDGSLKAQMGLPDMKLPIQYAMGYPERLASTYPRFQFTDYPQLTFEQPDPKSFRNLGLAYEALKKVEICRAYSMLPMR